MFLLHIQAEMVPTANISHKTMPRTLSMGCFSYTSWLKWCLQEFLPQTSAKYAIYRMFLLHIQAEMVPMTNISHKLMPSTLSAGCFSYTSRLKWCPWRTLTHPCPPQYLLDVSLTDPGQNCAYTELLPQTHAQYALCRMFLLHIQAEMVPKGTPPTNQCPVCYIQDVSLTQPG